MESEYYDQLFIEIIKQFSTMKKNGLLELTAIDLENQYFTDLLNRGIYHTQISTLPQVLDTIIESKIVEIVLGNTLTVCEIRGLIIIQEIVHAFRLWNFDTILELTLYYCSEKTSLNFCENFSKICKVDFLKK